MGAAPLLVLVAGAALAGGLRQTPIEVEELALYRLTPAVFTRFEIASRSIAMVTRKDPAFARDPLFTREVVVSGDAPAVATTLETRLRTHPDLARSLGAAKLSAREYTRFAIALFAARLAHGFVKAGVLRGVPDGAAAANVAFVESHEEAITALLVGLGIDG
jgi:hypothetical protein